MRMRIALVALACLSSACGRKDLTREAASPLVQGRVVAGLRACFKSGGIMHTTIFGQDASDPHYSVYQSLMNAGILSCVVSYPGAPNLDCTPGPKAVGFIDDHVGSITAPAGNLIVSGVTGITKTGENSALAQLQLQFQPIGSYAQYRNLINQIDGIGVLTGTQPVRVLAGRNTAQATFQRYDDGWRLQNIQ